MTTPHPYYADRCECCGFKVNKARADFYADVLGVDWVLCARCTDKGTAADAAVREGDRHEP